MDQKEVQDEVRQAVDAAESSSSNTSENESSQDVKAAESTPKEAELVTDKAGATEQPADETGNAPKEVATEDVAKPVKEIEENLKKALQREREERRREKEELEAKLRENENVIGKLKTVFSPEAEKEEAPEPPKYLTQEDLNNLLEEKERERETESQRQKQIEAMNAEINKLESEWDGKDGKPKYNDEEVVNWQRDNNKLYLTPEEAFFAMNKTSIIDWEIKNRMSKRGSAPSVESGGTGAQSTPEETPLSDDPTAIRRAVLEEMSNVEADI